MATTKKSKTKMVKDRAGEPSTWSGLAAILLAAGQAFLTTGSKTAAIVTGLAAAAGGAAAVMPEKAKASAETPK